MIVARLSDPVVWQDVECGAYTADLPLWSQLAEEANGPVLELGCGCGRVALHLARLGVGVFGIDTDGALIEELHCRALAEEMNVNAERTDASDFSLDERFGLIIAPMQVLQLLDKSQRGACLRRIEAHLRPGGVAAIALVGNFVSGVPPSPLLPDVRELNGWVYSSLPLGVVDEGRDLCIERLRQTVSPQGAFGEARNRVRLHKLTPTQLEHEAGDAGLREVGHRVIEADELHEASVVVLLGA